MKQPRQLWYHPESDCYMESNLTHSSPQSAWEKYAECDEVSGVPHHEEQFKRRQNPAYKTNWMKSRDAWNQWQYVKKSVDRIAGLVQNGSMGVSEEELQEWKGDFKVFLEAIVHAKQLTESALEKIK